MLQCRNLIKDFGGRRLFTELNLQVNAGERIGLCGDNGAGKTTLLRLLAGKLEADGGQLQWARQASVGYLPQDGLEYRGRTLFAEVHSALDDLLALEQDLRRREETLAEASPAEMEEYARLQQDFDWRGGYAMEAEVGRVLSGLGFDRSVWEKPCEQFSGGWQMRIALARLLLQRPTLLLLDEPTNHLDLPARDWLEDYLTGYPYAVILVSHDRFFLDRVVTRIVELWNARLSEYPGNYSHYLVERERRIAALREQKRRQDEEIEKTEAFINRFRYQANKASLVQSRIRQLEKVERIVLPPQRKHIAFRFPDPPSLGRDALRLEGIHHGYGPLPLFSGDDLLVERGERLALVGPNGAGKSTLMRLLAGSEAPQQGTRAEGHNLRLAYFAQNQAEALDPRRTVLEELSADAPIDMVPRLRTILGSFLFSGEDVEKKVAVLSGGERNRLALAKLLLRPANLLLLDEPTNHLDLQSKDVLLEALSGFKGTLVFVSHDRFFVDALATRVVAVGGGSLESHLGNYEDFLRAREAEGDRSHSRERVEQSTTTTAPVAEKLSHEERKEQKRRQRQREKQLAEAEARAETLEEQLQELEEQLQDPQLATDVERLTQLGFRHRELQEERDAAYRAWEALEAEEES